MLGHCPEQRGQHRADRGIIERPEADLGQLLTAAQLGPDRPQPVIARQLVAPVAGHQQHRLPARRVGQRGKQVEGGLIRPLQIVDEGHSQQAGRGADQRRAGSLGRRRKPDFRRRRPEFGQDHREDAGRRAGQPGQRRA